MLFNTLALILAQLACVIATSTESIFIRKPLMELRVFDAGDAAASTANNPAATMTLREAFDRYWLPVNQYLVADSTAQKYRTAIDHWETYQRGRDSSTRTVAPRIAPDSSPDCPVSQIDAAMLNEFGVWLMADDSPSPGLKQSTVTETAKKIHAILRAVGPRDAKHPHSPAVLETVPVMAPARRLAGGKKEATKSGRNLSDDELGAIYEACDVAAWPPEVPALQWRTFVVFTSLIAARAGDGSRLSAGAITLDPEIPISGSTLSHEFGWVDFEADKTEKQHLVPLPPCVSSHVAELLRRRGSGRDRLYGWESYRQRPFVRQWKAIVAQAGLPDVVIKDLRMTANNRWNSVRDGLGDWLLGHSASGVNDRHYRDRLPDAIAASLVVAVPPQFNLPVRGGVSQTFLF